jgi:NADPH2:quinone reductase
VKAWVARAFAEPFAIAIEQIERPEPGPGEVRIRVHAAGLSYGEVLVLEGRYQKTPPLPYVPAHEVAGIVDACGDGVTRFRPGDRVGGFSIALDGGALAEFCVMSEAFVFGLPETLAFADAAAFPMNYWTAFNALVRRGALQAGETLVVHGATGGVGSAAVAVGHALGARVIATGSDDTRLAATGAPETVNLTTRDLREAILDATAGVGADVYFDPVGGDVFDASMRAIAPGGRILVVGFTSGRPAQARTNVLLVKMVSVIGVEARLAVERTGGQGLADFAKMLRWLNEGRLRPRAGLVLAFGDAADGYRRIVAREASGKVVVTMPSN